MTNEDLMQIVGEVANTIAGGLVRDSHIEFLVSLPKTEKARNLNSAHNPLLRQIYIVDDTQLIEIQVTI